MMVMLLMMNIIMILTWTVLSVNNPMNMSLMITTMAMMMSLLMSLTMSSWYAMTLFLIYIGGMMMMFSYFVSLSSNDSMMMKSKFHFIILPFTLIKMFKLQPMLPMYNSMEMNKLYLYNNMTIMLLMTMILFMMMLIIVKMVKINNGPLRSFNKL